MMTAPIEPIHGDHATGLLILVIIKLIPNYAVETILSTMQTSPNDDQSAIWSTEVIVDAASDWSNFLD